MLYKMMMMHNLITQLWPIFSLKVVCVDESSHLASQAVSAGVHAVLLGSVDKLVASVRSSKCATVLYSLRFSRAAALPPVLSITSATLMPHVALAVILKFLCMNGVPVSQEQ